MANESSASSALHTNGGVSSGVSGGGGVDLSLPSQLRSSRSLVGEALTRASSQLIMGDLYVRVCVLVVVVCTGGGVWRCVAVVFGVGVHVTAVCM